MRARPWEVPDGLWERIEPMLPKRQRRFRYPGRKPLDDRLVLHRRRLLIRTDRRDDIHEGFLALACCLICWRRLESLSLAGNRVGARL